jgi:hypothetical protein
VASSMPTNTTTYNKPLKYKQMNTLYVILGFVGLGVFVCTLVWLKKFNICYFSSFWNIMCPEICLEICCNCCDENLIEPGDNNSDSGNGCCTDSDGCCSCCNCCYYKCNCCKIFTDILSMEDNTLYNKYRHESNDNHLRYDNNNKYNRKMTFSEFKKIYKIKKQIIEQNILEVPYNYTKDKHILSNQPKQQYYPSHDIYVNDE